MIRTRKFSFRSWMPHLAAILVILACARLAVWQIDRAEQKRQLIDQWETAPALSFEQASASSAARYSQITGHGQLDGQRHVLLDNQIRNNHPGVHVFSLFQPDNSDQLFLVNRGWQPWSRRSGQWPEFDTPTGRIEITGRLSDPPRVGLQIGRADPLDTDNWPNLMTYYDQEHLVEAFGPRLASRVILLDPDHPVHFTGDDWRLINMGPEKHHGYAFQWASIGTAVLIIWVVLTLRRFRRQ